MIVELDEEHTKCSICITEFSCDRDSPDQEIRDRLPVLSSSQRCDHWFCHGCILSEQRRVAVENNGRLPKWIKCMHCRAKTSFNPAEPMYHRLLIDLLSRAQKHAVDQVNTEETEFVSQPISGGNARPEDFFRKGSINYAVAAVFLSSEFKEGCGRNHLLEWEIELPMFIKSWALHFSSFDDEFLGYTSRHSAIRTVYMIGEELKSRVAWREEWDDFSPDIVDVIQKHLSYNKVGQSSKNEIESFARLVQLRCNSLYTSGQKWLHMPLE